jgi:predicted Zn finger-like uncharacterized protein
MDVRCEKCLTVYDFDESQVGPTGVTVKCTQCGNLFKVKRRQTMEFPAKAPPVAPAAPPSFGASPRPASPRRATATVGAVPAPMPAIDNTWKVRLAATGEVYRFHELSTLQQWIAERKVARTDEISRGSDTWRPLGAVNELAPYFAQLEPAWHLAEEDPALSTTAPMKAPQLHTSGPTSMGSGPSLGSDDPAFASTTPKPRVEAPQLPLPPVDDDLAELDQPARTPWGRVVGGLLVVLVLGGVGYVAAFERARVKALFGSEGGRGHDAYLQGRAAFLLDSDDELRKAGRLFATAHGADETNALPIAGLAEVNATWAAYLRDDARAHQARDPEAAKRDTKEAQSLLDEARRYAADAVALAPDGVETNRAMADYLRVDGAPAAEVDRYLARAIAKGPSDGEALFVAGALAAREGRAADARTKLEQADQLTSAVGQPGLLRAEYLLARLSLAAGDRDGARKAVQKILATNPQHDRARALLSLVDAQPDAGAPDLAPAATAAAVPAPLAPTGAAAPEDLSAAGPGAYNKLVAAAEKQLVNGHTDSARKLYEKALAVKSDGVEAMTGLGYCDLDKERFLAAVDHFKQALGVAPEFDEAVIGLAEAYKIRGDKPHALEFYKRYLKSQPNGPRAQMAQKNVRELEGPARTAPVESSPEKSEKTEELPKAPPSPSDEPPP